MQVDYRNHPNAPAMRSEAIAGNAADRNHTGDYDRPIGADWQQAEPWTDQTWEGYDSTDDALRFRGINSPAQQAELHAEPDPVQGSKGWSPDLEQILAWERQVSGAPPT